MSWRATEPPCPRAAGRGRAAGTREAEVRRRSTILGVAGLVAARWATPAPLLAAGFQPGSPLQPGAPGAGDRFGSALAIGDESIGAGAPLSDPRGKRHGAGYR